MAVERKDECVKPGMMCALVAAGHRPGMSRLHMCVDCRIDPSGSMTVMGEVASCLFWTRVPSNMKWLVAPELLMAEVGYWPVGVFDGWAETAARYCGAMHLVSFSVSSSKPVKRANWFAVTVKVAKSVE